MASDAPAPEAAPAPKPARPRAGGHRRSLASYWPLAIAAIAVLLVPNVIQPALGDRWLPMTTVVVCAIYVLFALGLNVVVGYAGLLDLGYVAFFLFGAYSAAWTMSIFFTAVLDADGKCESDRFRCWLWDTAGPDGVHIFDAAAPNLPGIHLSFWIVIFIGGALAAVSGVLIGAPTLRLKSDYLALVTLGFGEILPQLFRNAESLKGFNLSNGTKGIGPLDALDMSPFSWIPGVPTKIGPFDYTSRYYVIVGLAVVFVILSLKLRGGRLGRAWVAIREDELAASLMGVPLMRAKLWSYAIGAVAGGVAGCFYAISVNTVNVDTFNFQFSVIVLCLVIVGGMGNVWGVAIGAAVVMWVNQTGLKEIGNQVNTWFGTSIDIPRYTFLMFGVVLVLMMLFRRDGILPESRTRAAKKLDAELEQKQVQGASA